MINTKTFIQLEDAQNATIEKFNLNFSTGIKNGHVDLEDGLPWLEVNGKINKTIAKQFAQELADTMNIRILYNRLEADSIDDACLHLVMDFSPDAGKFAKDEAIPANSTDPDAAEFMEDYGREIFPKGYKKR